MIQWSDSQRNLNNLFWHTGILQCLYPWQSSHLVQWIVKPGQLWWCFSRDRGCINPTSLYLRALSRSEQTLFFAFLTATNVWIWRDFVRLSKPNAKKIHVCRWICSYCIDLFFIVLESLANLQALWIQKCQHFLVLFTCFVVVIHLWHWMLNWKTQYIHRNREST